MQAFTITTLGCKVNQCDSSALLAQLRRYGLIQARPDQPCDLLVVNTCCVTTSAMRKSRQAIRKALRQSPKATVMILGCYATYHRARLAEVLGDLDVPLKRSLIVGHHEDVLAKLNELLERKGDCATHKNTTTAEGYCATQTPANLPARRNQALAGRASGTGNLPLVDNFEGHQRAFVKVQDGCDAFCSYCVVCYTRPRVTSKTIEQVETQCRKLISAGHREIVLCGVFLGAFGRDTAVRKRWASDEPPMLEELLGRIAELDGLWRVRLSSLEPGDVTPRLLDIYAARATVAPHFHLPLQSGSERILDKMNRQYTPEQFVRTIETLRSRLDRPAITTDIIVGFPGEGEAEFAQTLDLARLAGFAKIHAFPFSAIEPTAAWRYRHEAPRPEVVRERLGRLAELESDLAGRYSRQFLGQTLEGVVETTGLGSDIGRAMTDRYLRVQFSIDSQKKTLEKPGSIVSLRINSAAPTGLNGTIEHRIS
jgi:threonylcarbamoyladenosine tRNA methylthiotransferase MtaB